MQDSSVSSSQELIAKKQQDSADSSYLSKMKESPKIFILKILLKNLPGSTTQSAYCEEFFNLIASIIRTCADNFVIDQDDYNNAMSLQSLEKNQKIIDMRRVCINDEQFSASYLLQVLIEQIMKRPTLETRASGYD